MFSCNLSYREISTRVCLVCHIATFARDDKRTYFRHPTCKQSRVTSSIEASFGKYVHLLSPLVATVKRNYYLRETYINVQYNFVASIIINSLQLWSVHEISCLKQYAVGIWFVVCLKEVCFVEKQTSCLLIRPLQYKSKKCATSFFWIFSTSPHLKMFWVS